MNIKKEEVSRPLILTSLLLICELNVASFANLSSPQLEQLRLHAFPCLIDSTLEHYAKTRFFCMFFFPDILFKPHRRITNPISKSQSDVQNFSDHYLACGHREHLRQRLTINSSLLSPKHLSLRLVLLNEDTV